MKIKYDEEYENIDGENLNLRRFDKHKYCLFLSDVGENQELFIVEPHCHEWLEIVHITEGEMTVYTPQGETIVHKGNTVVIGMQTLHKIIAETGHYNYQCIHINIGFILQYMSSSLLNDKVFIVQNEEEFQSYCSTIIQLINHDDVYSQLRYKASILNILALCVQETQSDLLDAKDEINDIFSDILFYVSTHYQDNISLQKLSQEFSYTTQHISLLFKKNLNTTYYTYLTKIRLDRAKFLLMTTQKRNLDIAIECGFSNEHSLISHFKKSYHETPSQFRKKHQIKDETIS